MDSQSSKLNFRSVAVYILLTVLATLGNYFNITLFMGINFVFGTIALYAILRFYGILPATLAAIVANSVTFFLWNHPYGIILFTLEILVIGFIEKKNGSSPIVTDLYYWVFLGAPLVYLFYYIFLQMSPNQTILILLKNMVNGVFNIIIADLILTSLLSQRWFKLPYRRSTSLYRFYISLVTFSVILPTLLISVVTIKDISRNTLYGMTNDLDLQSERIVLSLEKWYQERVLTLNALATQVIADDLFEHPEIIQEFTRLIRETSEEFISVYVADKNGKTIAFYPMSNTSGGPNLGLDFSDRNYFTQLRTSMKPVVSNVIEGRVSKRNIITISVPIIREGIFSGYITAGVEPSFFQSLIEQNTNNDNFMIMISDEYNTSLASTTQQLTTISSFFLGEDGKVNFVDDSTYHWVPNTPGKSNLTNTKESYYVRKESVSGEIPWILTVSTPIAPFIIILERYYIKSFLIMILVSSIVFMLSYYYMTNFIKEPLEKLAAVTELLPENIAVSQELNLGESIITEIETLGNNYKSAFSMLRNNFLELNENKNRLEQLVTKDSLTGLNNLFSFNRILASEMERALNENKKLAVLFIDLDRFKIINDTVGHTAGNEVIKTISELMQRAIGSEYKLSRVGGDEFAVVIPDIIYHEQVEAVANSILNSMQHPLVMKGYEFRVSTSIGISLFPSDGSDTESLLKNADFAMCHAKKIGKNNFIFYSDKLESELIETIKMETHLWDAISNDEFSLHYQPQVEIHTGDVIGMEALIRWNSSTLGFVSPADFIPIAEETGLIVPIGEWVFETACRQNKYWQDIGLKPIPVSVNISAVQFQDPTFINTVTEVLMETKLDPKWIEIEITESTAIKNVSLTLEVLEKLKEIGIKVAIDDFGKGFSSLNYLKNFKIDTLKIDSGFIDDVVTSDSSAAIVSTIISLAKHFKLKVVAEGVEEPEQRVFLQKEGCDVAQGYLFSRPVAALEAEKLLRNLSEL